MSLPRAFRGEMYTTSTWSNNSPRSAFRTSASMQTRNAASVLPEPVGAAISVAFRSTIDGHPASCGSVGVPNRPTNHSCTIGCAHPIPATPVPNSDSPFIRPDYRRIANFLQRVGRRAQCVLDLNHIAHKTKQNGAISLREMAPLNIRDLSWSAGEVYDFSGFF